MTLFSMIHSFYKCMFYKFKGALSCCVIVALTGPVLPAVCKTKAVILFKNVLIIINY